MKRECIQDVARLERRLCEVENAIDMIKQGKAFETDGISLAWYWQSPAQQPLSYPSRRLPVEKGEAVEFLEQIRDRLRARLVSAGIEQVTP